MSDEQITPDEGTAAPAPGDTAGAGGPSRRGLLKAGIVAGAVAGTGAWREAPGNRGRHHHPRHRNGRKWEPEVEVHRDAGTRRWGEGCAHCDCCETD